MSINSNKNKQNKYARSNIECEVLEQYTSLKENDIWNDYVAIFMKGSNYISNYPNRIIYNFDNYINGTLYPNHEEYINKLEYVSL